MALNKCYQPPSTWCHINAGLSVLRKMWPWKQRKLRSPDAFYTPRTVWRKMAGGRKRERQTCFLLLSKATTLNTTMCDKILLLQLTNGTKLIKLATRTATEKFRRTFELAWRNSYIPSFPHLPGPVQKQKYFVGVLLKTHIKTDKNSYHWWNAALFTKQWLPTWQYPTALLWCPYATNTL